jgi:hypothetical protein
MSLSRPRPGIPLRAMAQIWVPSWQWSSCFFGNRTKTYRYCGTRSVRPHFPTGKGLAVQVPRRGRNELTGRSIISIANARRGAA